MIPRRRKSPAAARRPQRPIPQSQSKLHLYQGRARRTIRDIYEEDHPEPLRTGQFRWLISSCAAAGLGVLGLSVLIAASIDPGEDTGGFLPAVQRMSEGLSPLSQRPTPRRAEGLPWSLPKSDRLVFDTGAVSSRFIIKDTLTKQVDERAYIKARHYARIVSRLATAPEADAGAIPPFNPLQLYAIDQASVSGEGEPNGVRNKDGILTKIVGLLGGLLSVEDGYETSSQEAFDLVKQAQEDAIELARLEQAAKENPAEPGAPRPQGVPLNSALPTQTTDIPKSSGDLDEVVSDETRLEPRSVRAQPGETLDKLLLRFGADKATAQEMANAARAVLRGQPLATDRDIRLTLAPSVLTPGSLDPVGISLVVGADGQTLSVTRTKSGEFATRLLSKAEALAEQNSTARDPAAQPTSLYASLYRSGLLQRLSPEGILHIMRIHAYGTDFSLRARAGDTAEFLLELAEESALDGPPGELLFTSITALGATHRYYRFRTPDGVTDYYDETGSNSKKFLMPQPVRGSSVRRTSGFGMRVHPIAHVRKMHQGIDWAGEIGTPILAAGNGVLEFVGRHGGYGNFIKIRHANGYATAYAHMYRFADKIATGGKVRQGQLIGYLGSTGSSTGAHLHYEVHVSGRPVDPSALKVPQERQLQGQELSDFQKERARIDDLLRRSPVARYTQ